jgi:hypothetical protein
MRKTRTMVSWLSRKAGDPVAGYLYFAAISGTIPYEFAEETGN